MDDVGLALGCLQSIHFLPGSQLLQPLPPLHERGGLDCQGNHLLLVLHLGTAAITYHCQFELKRSGVVLCQQCMRTNGGSLVMGREQAAGLKTRLLTSIAR